MTRPTTRTSTSRSAASSRWGSATTAPRTRLRDRLVGLAAALTLAGIVAGLPAVLLALGGLPTRLPTLPDIVDALTRPDDGTVAITALVVLGWILWTVLTVAIAAEALAALRGRTPARLPGLGLPQGTARVLVGAATLLFASTPAVVPTTAPAATVATPATLASAVASTASTTITPTGPAGRAGHTGDTAQTASRHHHDTRTAGADSLSGGDMGRTHVVQRGDSLWSIAERHLGSGRAYPQIAALNRDILGSHPDFLTPGTVLRLPTPTPRTDTSTLAATAEATRGQYVVRAGDTLSGIAGTQLGDPRRFPEIFDASRDITQPDGRHLTDPDVIDIGWRLNLPATATPQTLQTRTGTPADTPGHDTADIHPDSRDSSADRPLRRPELPGHDTTPTPTGATGATDAATGDTAADTGARPTGHSSDLADPGATPPGPVVTPGPSPHATPQPGADTSPATADTHPGPVADEQVDDAPPAWQLTGLTGAGSLLAGSLLLALRARRRAQWRARRPGRTIALPPPTLAPVEKTVTYVGEPAHVTVDWLDHTLRRLAATQAAAGQPMPPVAAIELGATHLTLHLTEPLPAPAPWQANDDSRRWHLPRTTDPAAVGPDVPDQPAPYPLLVTIGAADTGQTWLLNCELLTPIAITGDPTYGRDLARYLAADLACNPWSAGVTVDCIGLAEELATLNPERIRTHPDLAHPDRDQPPHEALGDALADATATRDRAADTGLDPTTARAHQAGEEAWHARLLLLDAHTATAPSAQRLIQLIEDHPAQTATAVVLTANHGSVASSHVQVHVTDTGRVTIPHAGLDLIAVGLTPDEARGCAALLAHADTLDDTAIPVDPVADAGDGWRALADDAGALRPEHTQPRDTLQAVAAADHPDRPTSILDLRDDTYLQQAATTTEDLQALAPAVTAQTRTLAEDTDPTLEADLNAWFSDGCDLPRLTLLGPVRARTRGTALTKRKPYYTELLAYLATRPYGATPDELADAFNLTPARARNDVKIVRDWLGINPRTGRKHLPDAREAPAALTRGVGVYQVQDVLVDADLFRRLRVRGESRGRDGIHDLRRALTLVEGRPFDRLRPGGWSWLLEGDRLDHHMLCAVVDVAHLVTTHSLTTDDHRTARAAAELALLAAPHEEIPRLDLAAVAAAEGHHHEAERIVRDDICNRADDNAAPDELPDRTQQILEQHSWLKSGQAAS